MVDLTIVFCKCLPDWTRGYENLWHLGGSHRGFSIRNRDFNRKKSWKWQWYPQNCDYNRDYYHLKKKKNLGSSSSLFSNKPKAPFEKPGELFLCRVVSGSIFPSRILNWGSTILRWKRGKLGYGVRDLGYKNGPATAKFIKCFFDPTIELSVGNIHVWAKPI